MTFMRSCGVSMVEMLVALAILAVITAAFAPALASSSRLQRASAIESRAALAAAAQLEDLKHTLGAGAVAGTAVIDGFEVQWSIAPLPALDTVRLIVVRARLAGDEAVVTLSEVVPDE